MITYVADTENLVPPSTLYDDTAVDATRTPDDAPVFDTSKLTGDRRRDAESETRVWAFALCPVKDNPTDDDVITHNNITDAMENLETNIIQRVLYKKDRNGNVKTRITPTTVFFHNLAYDGPLIMTWLLNNGFKHAEQKRGQTKPGKNQFWSMISDDGVWYSLQVTFNNSNSILFRDSMKILPFSVDSIGKSLNTNAQKLKGSIDYSEYREYGHVITDVEAEYIRNDVLVMAEALHKIDQEFPGYTDNFTIGSGCMTEFKTMLARSCYTDEEWDELSYDDRITAAREIYKQTYSEVIDPDLDEDLRKSYRGGWCYVNRHNPDISRNQIVDFRNSAVNGEVYDVNSLYPSAMYNHTFPIGYPTLITGKAAQSFDFENNTRPYIIEAHGDFDIRPGFLPFIQLKGNSKFAENEYVEHTNGVENFTLTGPDFELMQTHYRFNEIVVDKVWLFDSVVNPFNEYIDKWYAVKEHATTTGNKVMRMIAKLHLNNLYGKFAQREDRDSGIPSLNENGKIVFETVHDLGPGGYIPTGAYITAYARGVTIRAAQANYDNFYYADTDSIHMKGLAQEIEVDPGKLGAWDHESTFTVGRYVRQKTYIELNDDGIDIKACGANPLVKERLRFNVSEYTDDHRWVFDRLNLDADDEPTNEPREIDEVFERFAPGLREAGKLTRRMVPGGTVLVETTFSIHGETNPGTNGVDLPEWTVVH